MKYLYLYATLIVGLLSFTAKAQHLNFVPNGSFEQHPYPCPFGGGASASTGWRDYNAGSVDYYHVCNLNVPRNWAGFQYPAEGDAYIGLVTYYASYTYSEYAASAITELWPGYKYRVSMSVTLADSCAYMSNGLGVWFYDNGPTTPVSGITTLSVTPQISYNSYGIISDTQNWLRVVDTFTADSAYDNMVVGAFGTVSFASTGRSTPSMANPAYYFIDSIVVELDYTLRLRNVGTVFCVGDTLVVPYEAGYPFASGNVFSLQISSSTGSFASPNTVATITGTGSGVFKYVIPSSFTPGSGYRVRVVASNPGDNSGDNGYDITIGNVTPAKPTAGNNGPVCTGNTLSLSAGTTTAGVTWSWTGPGSFNSTLQNPSISAPATTATGQYIVTATLNGCKSRDTTNATVISLTGGISNTSNSPVCEGDTLKLLGNIIFGTSSSYTWAGPNSFSSSSKDTIIAGATTGASGDYILTAVFAGGCIARDTVTAVVNAKVGNHTGFSNTPVCTGDTLKLFAFSTTPGMGFLWSGPASYASAAAMPMIMNVTTAAAGRYIVAATTGNGCYYYDTVNVTVNQSPNNITASSNAPVCLSDTLKLFSTNSSSGVIWSWAGPNSFTASSRDTFIANAQLAATGRYYVKAAAANGCFRRDSVDVTVKPLPAGFSASSNSPQCQGATLALTGNTTSSGVSWSWAGPNSFGSTSQSPSFINAQSILSGRYILTATLNGCSIKDTEMVSVISIPSTPVPQANTPVCVGQTLNLNAFGAGPAYIWSGPNSFVGTSATPSIPNATGIVAGVYTVKAVDGACESAPGNVTVTVIPAPAVTMYPSPKDSICAGSTVIFSATASNAGSGPVYKWYRNNTQEPGAFTSGYSTIPLSDYDTYFCTVTSNGTCATPFVDTSNTIVMRLFPVLPASVAIAATPNGPVAGGTMINFTATPVNGGNFPQYQWKRNNNDVVGALSNTWGAKNLSDKDVICVEMSSSYLCPQPKTATSNCITVSINTTGIDAERLNQINIYPNPVKDQLTIEHISKGTKLQLFDVTGRLITELTATGEKETINTSSLPAGIYMLKITDTDGKSVTAKLTKE